MTGFDQIDQLARLLKLLARWLAGRATLWHLRVFALR
jgi:hypothetical protein